MKIREAIDRSGAARHYTDEGFLIVPAQIGRAGIQEYRAYELGVTDGDPMRIVRVYRPPAEVFAAEAMQSFENKPATDNHPDEAVDASNWKEHAVGFARNIRRDGKYLVADLIVSDKKAIDLINAGKVELSCGYSHEIDWTPGKTPDGEAYDAQQKNIRGNHVALVDAARCGSACRVSDNQTKKEKPMADRKVTIDGIPFDLPEAAAAAVDKLTTQLADAKKALDAAPKLQPLKIGDVTIQVSDTAPVLKLISDHGEEVAKLKRDTITPEQRDALVETWATLTIDAKRLVKDFDPKGKTCDKIRREVIAACQKDEARKPMIDAALAGRELDKVDAETVKTVFNMLAAQSTDARANDRVADALRNQGGKEGGEGEGETLVGRDAMLARQQKINAGT